MAKGKFVTHKQAVYLSTKTGRFVSAKFAKAHPKTTIKKNVVIKHAL